MIEFLVDNIFLVFAGKVFQQIIGIPMGTNCAPLLADIFLYSYEAEFIQSLFSTSKKRLASQFNFTYRYIDDVLSINYPDFENYLGKMYPPELEINDTTESNTSASYLDLLLSIGRDGQLRTSLYDKRDDFNFHITNFPFLSSNIPSSPAYGVFISQLIWYARACSSYECFILRAMRLSNKLLGQGYVKERLKSSLRKFYVRYRDLTKQYEVPLSGMLHDILVDDHIQWHPPLLGHYTNSWPLLIWTLLTNLTFYLIVQGFHRTYATGAACQQRTLTPPDTWSCPTLGLACVLMSRPISPELVLSLDFWIWTSLGTSLCLKSDSINNIDHMRISGTEPSSVILNQKKCFQKLKWDVPNVPKQAEAKRDGVINPLNYDFNNFNTEKYCENSVSQSVSHIPRDNIVYFMTS